MERLTIWRVIASTAFAYSISLVFGGLRRLYFHPLSKFPGPPLAAATLWWQVYYDVVLGGKLNARLITLHEKYGPVVRIGPNQLHFNDLWAYYDIYAPNSMFTKDPAFYEGMLTDDASFGTTDRNKSKARRATLAPFFSKSAVSKLEWVIQDKIDRLISQLLTHKGEPVNMHMAFRSATLDIIMEYTFAQSFDTLGARHFCHPTLVNLQDGIPAFSLFRHFKIIPIVMMSLPRWLLVWINPGAQGVVDVLRLCERQSDKVLSNPTSLHQAPHEIIYHHLVQLNPEKRTRKATRTQMVDEAHTLLRAGSDTTGGTCTVGTFHVFNNKEILGRVRKELDEIRPTGNSSMTSAALEKLPYLTAVIKEALRLNFGVVTPLPRVVGPDDSIIAGYSVPAGSIVAIGSTDVHLNKEVFPEPEKFDPERWLQPNSKDLEKWLVPFSTGPRQCVGMNLAWTELYLIFGNVFSKLDMTIHDTKPEDFLNFDEQFLPFYAKQFHAYVKARSEWD